MEDRKDYVRIYSISKRNDSADDGLVMSYEFGDSDDIFTAFVSRRGEEFRCPAVLWDGADGSIFSNQAFTEAINWLFSWYG